MDLGERKAAFKALVGSHNYNLNTEESNKDYKLFVLPNFDDLYFGKSFNVDYIGKTEDFNVHDIRKCSSLWFKANVNFLEVLFSNEFSINEDLDEKSKGILKEIYNMRDDIAKMNLSFLYDACIGMHYNKMKLIKKGTSGTSHLLDKFGYDTKQAMQAWRILDFLRAFSDTNFSDFKSAIWYSEDNNKRQFMLDIRAGKFTFSEYTDAISNTFKDVDENFQIKYKNSPIDKKTNERLITLLKELIRLNL